jgi:DNA-damage-inducible protein J
MLTIWIPYDILLSKGVDIMSKVSTNISLDAETKAKAQAMLADLGMDLSTAVNIFLRQMLYEGGIPFSITRDVPNRVTVDAMKEAQEMLRSPEKYKKYDNVDSMMEDILGEI